MRAHYFYIAPTILDPRRDIVFNASSTLMNILEAGMINNFSAQISYSAFFSECDVTYCTYWVRGRRNIIIIITSLISLSGGLFVALKLSTPILVHILYWCFGYVQGKLPIHQNVILRRFTTVRDTQVSSNKLQCIFQQVQASSNHSLRESCRVNSYSNLFSIFDTGSICKVVVVIG